MNTLTSKERKILIPRQLRPENNWTGFNLSKTDPGPGNCCWPSPAQSFFVSGPVGTHDQIFVSSKTIYAFGNGGGGLLFDERRG
jgi:hypothetical protein